MSALSPIIQQLEARRSSLTAPYRVPGLWVDGVSTPAVEVYPYDFYHQRLTEIEAGEPQPLIQGQGGGEWTQHAMIYNLFPRVTAAFDHNNDGALAIRDDGWRETGTLLKCIALLPYIRSMGFNVVHLLPITSVGQDGKKGTLGSPYAIRNPYQLDPNLDEPALGLTADQLFAGFVEAAHRLGLRVILEFVLRTASKDSDWIAQHPDWFYWIRADIPDRGSAKGGQASAYGSPIFPPQTLDRVKAKVAEGDFTELPPPPASYRALFTPPPRPEQVYMENGRYLARLDDGTLARIPGAFTDWPPDDNQPPWTDVTYLRMYDHPDFNYIAYNTLRMYDESLARPENANGPLWDAVAGVIPHYQHNFGIDGVMIDMGHALPMPLKERIVATARAINPDFAFWDENFSIGPRSREEGYNAVMGWWVMGAHQGDSVRSMLHQIAANGLPIPFFAAPENHNTPRAASRFNGNAYAHYALALMITLPALPFVLSGFELCETQPINTGIGFTNEQLAQYPPEKLPLFSAWAFNWTRPDNCISSVRYALTLRRRYEGLLSDSTPSTIVVGYCDNPAILVFTRQKNDQRITVIANADPVLGQSGKVTLTSSQVRVTGLWGTADVGMDVTQQVMANVSLLPNYVLILDRSGMVQ
ncbi:MAG: alpha-amylase [Anaerolineae bacterium]|nr:alpha-amylase [Anaerolineae bacterium]